MTNLEKIKKMDADEMAEFFYGVELNPCTACCGNLLNCLRNNNIERTCKYYYKEWLESEEG